MVASTKEIHVAEIYLSHNYVYYNKGIFAGNLHVYYNKGIFAGNLLKPLIVMSG